MKQDAEPRDQRLSPHAQARREVLLETLRPVVAQRGQRRQRRKAAAIGAGIALLALLVAVPLIPRSISPGPTGPKPAIPGSTSEPALQLAQDAGGASKPAPTIAPARPTDLVPIPPPVSRVIVTIVHDDPTILARATVPAGVPVRVATNAELQAALRELGQDPGLVKIGPTMMLASQLRR